MTDTNTFDLVVLGGGSGGYAAALRAAELGSSVALIEKDLLGGTCLHRGCIPTKVLLHSAEVAETVRSAEKFGVAATLDGIDLGGVAAYRTGVVDALFRGLSGLVRSRRIEVIDGVGTVSSATSIDVSLADGGGRTVTGTNLLVATGSSPRDIPGVGVDHTTIVTSDDALALETIPTSAIILGAGAIGCEFASIWRAFGTEVTIIEALDGLVPLEEKSSGVALAKAFKRRGIVAITGERVASASVVDGGAEVTLEGGATHRAEIVLVAIGRAPTTAGIGLAEVGVEIERGYINVDTECRTRIPNIYAVGDVIPTLQLAHVGFAEGIMVAEVIAGLEPEPIDYSGVPRITYSHPEVASVGLTSDAAAEAGHEIAQFTYDLAGNGKARILGTSGSVKVIAAKDGPVLGIHMVGDRVGELISEAQLIVNWEASPDEVARHVHAHPTLSEAVGEAHLALAGKPLHSHA